MEIKGPASDTLRGHGSLGQAIRFMVISWSWFPRASDKLRGHGQAITSPLRSTMVPVRSV
jgi:hypothetical protein